MNVFTKSIFRIFNSVVRTYKTFPAAIVSALAFSVVTMIRIQLDWPQQEAYNFLFNCLHWSFALGSIFSLAVITASKSLLNDKKTFIIANLLGVVVVVFTFIVLHIFGGSNPDINNARYVVVSSIAAARVSVAIFISLICFIIFAGYPKGQSDFSKSLFMTQKAFFIAIIYGIVIMGGTSGVAGAIQALLYRDMSSKVYMYLGTLTGFLTFTIFVDYFPDFCKGCIDEHRETAQKQPRFVEILFEYIMIPIVLALTVVLLIWIGKTVVTGSWPAFDQLSGIATAYAVGGIWLHIMVTHHDTGFSKFYRRVYPVAAFIILVVEAWALLNRLQESGLKITEYYFSVVWIFAIVSVLMLFIRRAKAHKTIAILICVIAGISVLPVVGYQALPVAFQVSRLEKLLISQDMLKDEKIIPTVTQPKLSVRESITDAVTFLAYTEDAKLPSWFDKQLGESEAFKTRLGFEQVWSKTEYPYKIENGRGIYMELPSGAYDISGYRWVVNLQQEGDRSSVTIDGDRGSYLINWNVDYKTGIPVLKIELDNRMILEQDMNAYIDKITNEFSLSEGDLSKATFENMSLHLETTEVDVLLIYENININVNMQEDIIDYWFNLKELYLREKPINDEAISSVLN